MKEENKINLGNSPYARATEFSPIVRIFPKISKNALCPIENKKFKNCCGKSGQNFCNKAKENLENYLNELKTSYSETKND